MIFYEYIRRFASGALFMGVLCLVVFSDSCVKPEDETIFQPLESASCSDKILNQGEYFADCGGPCPACANDGASISCTIDSTWIDDSAMSVRIWTPQYKVFARDDKYVLVRITDSFEPNQPYYVTLLFALDSTWGIGVHNVDSLLGFESYIAFTPSSAGVSQIESGV